jgi:hypothetical protein
MTPTLRQSLMTIFREEMPRIFFGGLYEYTVKKSESGRLDLVPKKARWLMPLPAIEQWSVGGSEVDPKVGTSVAVAFLDGDESRPIVLGFLPKRASGGVPTKLAIDADQILLGTGSARFVREGDNYSHGTASGPITFVSVGGSDPNPTKVKG